MTAIQIPDVSALVFDVFGTVVDWRSSIIRELEAFGHERRISADWTALTDAEVTALPWLIRLRGAITVLWWIGRTAAVGDAGPIPARIQYMRNFVHWLDRYEQRFVDVVMQAAL